MTDLVRFIIEILNLILHGVFDVSLCPGHDVAVPLGEIDVIEVEHLKFFGGKPAAIRGFGSTPIPRGTECLQRFSSLFLQDASQLGIEAAIGFFPLDASNQGPSVGTIITYVVTQSLALLSGELLLLPLAFAETKPGIASVTTVEPARFDPGFPASHVFAVEDVYRSEAVAVAFYYPIVLLVVCALLGIGILEMGIDVA